MVLGFKVLSIALVLNYSPDTGLSCGPSPTVLSKEPDWILSQAWCSPTRSVQVILGFRASSHGLGFRV